MLPGWEGVGWSLGGGRLVVVGSRRVGQGPGHNPKGEVMSEMESF